MPADIRVLIFKISPQYKNQILRFFCVDPSSRARLAALGSACSGRYISTRSCSRNMNVKGRTLPHTPTAVIWVTSKPAARKASATVELSGKSMLVSPILAERRATSTAPFKPGTVYATVTEIVVNAVHSRYRKAYPRGSQTDPSWSPQSCQKLTPLRAPASYWQTHIPNQVPPCTPSRTAIENAKLH